MPKIKFASIEQVPAEFKDIAVAEGGEMVIDVVPKSQLDDFRTRNISVSTERDNLTALIARLQTEIGLDPEKLDDFLTEFSTMREIKGKVDDGKLVADTSLQDAIAQRTAQMQRDHQAQLQEARTREANLLKERDSLKDRVNRAVIDKEITAAAMDPKSGIRPDAINAVLREAYDFYSVDDKGAIIPKNQNGEIIYGSDGVTPMKPMEFFKTTLSDRAPYLFKDSSGGGAGGSGGGGGQLTEAQLANMSPEQKMDYARQNSAS